MSKITKTLIKKRNLYFILSLITWIGTATFFVFLLLSKGTSGATSTDVLSEDAKQLALSFGTTVAIALVLTILIKDKLRHTIWMSSIIMSAIIYDRYVMFVVFALYALDEFVLFGLYKHYSNRVNINKEIDLR